MFSIEISSFVIINYTMFNQQSKQCISSVKSEMSNLPNLRSFTFSNHEIKEYLNQMEPFTNCIVRSMWDNNYLYIK